MSLKSRIEVVSSKKPPPIDGLENILDLKIILYIYKKSYIWFLHIANKRYQSMEGSMENDIRPLRGHK